MSSKSSQLQIRVSAAQKRTIRRAAERAGMDMSTYVLSRVFKEPASRFQDLLKSLSVSATPAFPLAQINGFLAALGEAELREAVSSGPQSVLSPWLSNYVAAMVETACVKRSLPIPGWTRAVEPLEVPVFASTLHSLRLHLLTSSPPAFRRRNIFIDSTLGDQV